MNQETRSERVEYVVVAPAKLNPEQQEAVEWMNGPLLVLAGAGSGKTRVVTQRIVHLIQEGVDPNSILGLTFTNKAAKEMLERVLKLTSSRVLISTFHSLGARILRESITHLGFDRDFIIYDESDSEKLMKQVLVEFNLGDKKGELKTLRTFISNSKNGMLREDAEEDEDPEVSQLQRLYRAYQLKLKHSNALDFDDLLYLTVRLFQDHPAVLEGYQRRWRYLLIDEYQDTNQAQYTLVKLLVQKSRNICVVGDPDQSIYSWRGANLQNILHFEKDYPEAKVVRLEQNYRSVTNVLDAANALIQHNSQRIDKNLWSNLGSGERIRLYAADDEAAEARFVTDEIEYLQEREGISLSDIVVFYRTNAQSRALEDRLLSKRIPYTIVGGVSFYQRKEIKDVLAFLRMIQSGKDVVSFERTIHLPKRGIGDTTLEKMRLEAFSINLSLFDFVDKIVQEQIVPASFKLTTRQKNALQEYVTTIKSLKVDAELMPLSSLVITTIEKTGYLGLLKEEAETFEERKENLDALIAKAVEWQDTQEHPTLAAFLEELSLKSSLDEANSEGGRVSLMTIHNGKGLEFDVTFLVGMEETLFPHVNSLGKKDLVEEERRLCYVGITRARKILFMTYARARNIWGTWRTMNPSRFLREIPSEYLERVRFARRS